MEKDTHTQKRGWEREKLGGERKLYIFRERDRDRDRRREREREGGRKKER